MNLSNELLFDRDPLEDYILYLRQFNSDDRDKEDTEISGETVAAEPVLKRLDGREGLDSERFVSFAEEVIVHFHFLILQQHRQFLQQASSLLRSVSISECLIEHRVSTEMRKSFDEAKELFTLEGAYVLHEKEGAIDLLIQQNIALEQKLEEESRRVSVLQQDLSAQSEHVALLEHTIVDLERAIKERDEALVSHEAEFESAIQASNEEKQNLCFEISQLKHIHSDYLRNHLKFETENEVYTRENLKLKNLLSEMYSHYKKEAERGNQASKVIDALQRSREATSSPSQSRENSSLLFNRYPPPLFIEGAQGKGSKSRAPSEEYSLDDVSQFLDTNRSASESSGDADLTRWIKKEHYRYITEVEYLIEKKLLHLSRQEDPVGAREQDLEYLQLSDENQKFGERFRQIYAKAVQLNAQNESFRAQFTSLGKSKKSVKGGGSDSLYEKVLVEEYDGNVVRFISWLKQFLEETMILSEDDVEKGAPEDETGTPNRKIKNTRDHLIKEIKKEKARQRIDFWKNAAATTRVITALRWRLMNSILSERIIASFAQRNEDSVVISLVELVKGSLSDTQNTVRKTSLCKRQWLYFVRLVEKEIARANPPSSSSSLRCDVGIITEESFYAGLVEGACLTLGKSFCVFSLRDPALRREELIRQRSPLILFDEEAVDRLLRLALQCPDSYTGSLEFPPVPDSDVAYYMYSSGSTGKPKCIITTRLNLLSYLDEFCCSKEGMCVSGEDATVSLLTLSTPPFDPSIGDVLVSLTVPRASQYIPKRETLLTGEWGLLLGELRPTHIVSTPSVLSRVSPSSQRFNSDQKTKVFCGGERMAQSLIDEWAQVVDLYNVYGVTEATIYQSAQRVPPGTPSRDVGCGKGITVLGRFNISLDYASVPEDLAQKYVGVGEVVIRGPQVCAGYADERGESSFKVDPETGENLFYTGDLGAFSTMEDGQTTLMLKGRKDWQIKVNGQRVSLEEIEENIRTNLPTVVSFCCCGVVPNDAISIGAVVVLKEFHCDREVCEEHQACFAETFQRILQLYLPFHMIPRFWHFFPEGSQLAQTHSSKVDRTAAMKYISAHGDNSSSDTTGARGEVTSSKLVNTVMDAWRSFFNVSVTIRSNFFFLGGDSLGALKLTRDVFLRLGGREGDIDQHGGLPTPFQPSLLLSRPELGDYTRALKSALSDWLEKGESMDAEMRAHWETYQNTETENVDFSDAVEGEGHTSLFLRLVSSGYVRLAELFLNHNLANVDGDYTRSHRCVTPLHVAVSIDDATRATPMVSFLLEKGAKVSAVTKDGVSPAHLAAATSAPVLSLLILHSGGDASVLHCRDKRQQSLLHFAARQGNVEGVRLLLYDYKADITIRDKWQRTPAHWAVLNQQWEVLTVMADYVEEKGVGETRKGDSSRLVRLAKRKTHLPFESLLELASRIAQDNTTVLEKCEIISRIVQ